LQAAQSNNTWRGEFTITVVSPGSSAFLTAFGGMVYMATPSLPGNAGISGLYTSLGPVNLTAPLQLAVHCLFTTNTSPANICTQQQFIVEVLN